jgi:hypothetical protein
VLSDPLDSTRVLQIPTGRNPRGIVVNEDDTRAYVMNYISRDVTVIDLTGPREQVMATVRSAVLPTPGTLEEKVHIGKELYNTSIGVFDPATAGGTPIVGRMSAAGWGSCASCHPNGLSDNVVWIFAAGPRRTIPQHTDFDQTDPARGTQRALNWSAINDEEEDFELNIRNVSGGAGLIVLADGVTQDPNVAPFCSAGQRRSESAQGPRRAGMGRHQGIRAVWHPGAALARVEPGSQRSSRVARCLLAPGARRVTAVHSGRAAASTIRRRRARSALQHPADWPTPPGGDVQSGRVQRGAGQRGSTARGRRVRATLAHLDLRLPANLLHNGAADSLAAVLNNVTHRSAGTGGVDTLTNATDRQRLVDFLLSIDAGTVPFP